MQFGKEYEFRSKNIRGIKRRPNYLDDIRDTGDIQSLDSL
ncbi:MAG: hypothetical protein ACJAYJ_001050 [Saprospiraceae bacterium]|jgi:hypothetical protein